VSETDPFGTSEAAVSLELSAVLRSEWAEPGTTVWFVAYSLYLAEPPNQEDALAGTIIDLGPARLWFFQGVLPDVPRATFSPRPWLGGDVALDAVVEHVPLGARRGTWAVVFIKESVGSEPVVRSQIEAAVSIVRLIHGRNAAFAAFGEPVPFTIGGDFQVLSSGVENPLAFPRPDLSEARLRLASDIAAAASEPSDRGRRLTLALRWAARAQGLSGVDGFLSWWIAIETLAMPDTTNIAPLVEELSRLNGISTEEARARYHIGRLYRLRGRIVHAGQVTPLDERIVNFLAAVFSDLIVGVVGGPVRDVETLLANPEFDLVALLPEL
jgi:hypothetical protein